MEDEAAQECLVECEICGCPATRYDLKGIIPICDNPVCYIERSKKIDEVIAGLNARLKRKESGLQ